MLTSWLKTTPLPTLRSPINCSEEMMPLLFLHLLSIATLASANLQVGFYNLICPQAELIVRGVVQQRLAADPTVTAALLRLHFHDCFVRGCDASILIDSPVSEKQAQANIGVRGFDIIDQAKFILESQCPFTVSCADIIALATRDAVFLAGGLDYPVPTGRRDGLVSSFAEVNLPAPSFTLPQALFAFNAKGLTLEDMVVLLGGHTVGIAHCNFFRDRLFNFGGSGAPDPTMDPVLRVALINWCGFQPLPPQIEPSASLDQGTQLFVDNQYYNQLLVNRGILQIDQELALDSATVGLVSALASDGLLFLQRFALALIKMGTIQVLVDNAGEIRRTCNAFNIPLKLVEGVSGNSSI